MYVGRVAAVVQHCCVANVIACVVQIVRKWRRSTCQIAKLLAAAVLVMLCAPASLERVLWACVVSLGRSSGEPVMFWCWSCNWARGRYPNVLSMCMLAINRVTVFLELVRLDMCVAAWPLIKETVGNATMVLELVKFACNRHIRPPIKYRRWSNAVLNWDLMLLSQLYAANSVACLI